MILFSKADVLPYCLVLFLISLLLVSWVNRAIPDPYMDEMFHFDQYQNYCRKNFDYYNPKLTTPPGLYFFTLAITKPYGCILNIVGMDEDSLCQSVTLPRVINVILIPIVFLALVRFQAAVKRYETRKSSILVTALLLTLFPPLFFTSLLYYTDLLSCITVIKMLDSRNRGNHWLATFFWGLIAFSLRQTNIVWSVFCAGLTIWEEMAEITLGNKSLWSNESDIETLKRFLKSFLESSRFRCKSVIRVIIVTLPYLILGMIFLTYLHWNSGQLALGDHSAHQPVAHLVQFLYFSLFAVFFSSPKLLIFDLFKICKCFFVNLIRLRSKRRFHLPILLTSLVLVIVVKYFTFDHPYLLADNRHYPFYIWKRWFQRHWSCKYLLIPGYIFAVTILWATPERGFVWKLGFFISTALVTTPNRLMEFRYFIIPFIIWRLSLGQNDLTLKVIPELFEMGLYLVINCVTIWVFITRPFKWDHEPDQWQRFMW